MLLSSKVTHLFLLSKNKLKVNDKIYINEIEVGLIDFIKKKKNKDYVFRTRLYDPIEYHFIMNQYPLNSVLFDIN
jgi:hypothetical protein